jgi:hypothetical protein
MRNYFGSDSADVITITTLAVFDWVPDPARSGVMTMDYYLGGRDTWSYESRASGTIEFYPVTLEEVFTNRSEEWLEIDHLGPGGYDMVDGFSNGSWTWDPATGTLSGASSSAAREPYTDIWIDDGAVYISEVGPSSSAGPEYWYSMNLVEHGHWVARAYNSFVDAGEGDDTVLGGYGPLTADGGDGNDTLTARWGDAILLGGTGNDVLRSGLGRSLLDGGTGNDTLYGGTGQQTLLGGDGRDVIHLGDGSGLADGGRGDDTLVAGTGDQLLSGGAGRDTFVVGAGLGRVIIDDFRVDRDTLVLDGWFWDGSAGPAPIVVGDGGGDSIVSLEEGRVVVLLGVAPEVLAGHVGLLA